MLKLNRLLFATAEEVFINSIEPTKDQRRVLVEAKNEIRDHLRPRIREATIKALGMDKAVTPRFRTQGSWSYQTCVQPAWHPPQEMDWDFGVYLPVSLWEESGPPHAMAQLYFKLVEGLLKDLCKEKGWKLYSGKDTCIRVQINAWAHIDIPLYAAPEAQFAQIVEKRVFDAAAKSDAREALAAEFAEEDFTLQQWEDMVDIMMATRSGEWKPSDPEEVSRWFLDRVEEHTEQLRRVCRYLKAWRDLHWKAGDGPTSVCIMIAVAQAFEPKRGRDDVALERSARALSIALKGNVHEPAIAEGKEDFNKRLDANGRQHASTLAATLASQIQAARMKASHLAGDAIDILRAQLGSRLPYRTDLVEPDSGDDVVRLVGADRVSRPVVNSTSAG
ncbi:CBASS cGAMP synthase [Acidovorax sp. PRC11]|uniref:CBASS cGAMP synthase n=1 Tax=Acidovorax sp. PRC11 TaxID=2962592 RepID=UPI002880CD98|nr:CBASS cGAMP synthase [Acidovorax sp. PRC11]MDT0138256.1 CBASS cGAMP synthase [Acidovorax sp. PRC11]